MDEGVLESMEVGHTYTKKNREIMVGTEVYMGSHFHVILYICTNHYRIHIYIYIDADFLLG